MRRIAKRRAALDAEEAPVLLAAIAAEVHVHLGYGSVTEYLERACGYAPRTARERVRVAEALRELPALSGALAAGEVCFSAVKEMSRVLTAETEDEWLAAVAGCTVREIEDEMRGRQAGDRPGDRPDPSIEPRRVRLELAPETYALFLEARRALEREAGEPMTDSEFMAEACRRALSPAGDGRGNTPSHTIAVTTCRDCGRGWQETGSKSIELSPAALERARCDAFELGDVDGPAPAPTTRSIPAPIRRAVLARDHRRCCVPGCTSSQYVDVHHLVHRSVGGPHTMSNLITLCGRHHTAAHVGQISITGTAGALLVTHADGRPYGTPPDSRPVAAPRAAPTSPRPTRAAPTSLPPTRAAPTHACEGAMMTSSTTVVIEERDALIAMGVKCPEATRAVDGATSRVGRTPTVESLLRASLHILYPPQCTASNLDVGSSVGRRAPGAHDRADGGARDGPPGAEIARRHERSEARGAKVDARAAPPTHRRVPKAEARQGGGGRRGGVMFDSGG